MKAILSLFLVLILVSPCFAESFISLETPKEKIYTQENVYEFLGNKIKVTFGEQTIIIYAFGILTKRMDNNSFLLLGRTMAKNRITIPIEEITLIEILEKDFKDYYNKLYIL